jgi:hypothetical protein
MRVLPRLMKVRHLAGHIVSREHARLAVRRFGIPRRLGDERPGEGLRRVSPRARTKVPIRARADEGELRRRQGFARSSVIIVPVLLSVSR